MSRQQIFAGVCLAFCLMMGIWGAWQTLFQPRITSDAAIFAQMGRTFLQSDQTLYIDYADHKPPLIAVYFAPFVGVFGNTLTAMAVAAFVQGILATIAGTLTVSAFTKNPWARGAGFALSCLTAWILPLVMGANVVTPMAACTALAVATAVYAHGRARWLILAGVLFGLGFWFKQVNAPEGLAVLLFAWAAQPQHKMRSLLLMIAGGVLTIAGIGAWVLISHNAHEFWVYSFQLNFLYVAQTDLSGFSSLPLEELLRYFLRESLPVLLPLIVTAGISARVLWRQGSNRFLGVLVLWIILALIGASIGRALKLLYYGQAFIPLLTLIALGFGQFMSERRPRWHYMLAASALLLIGLVPVWVVHTYHTWDTGSGAQQQWARVVRAHTQEDDCVLTWGALALTVYLSGRDSCTANAHEAFVMNAAAFDIEPLRDSFLRQLLQRPPTLLISSSNWSYFPMLEMYMGRYQRQAVDASMPQIRMMDTSSMHHVQHTFGDLFTLVNVDYALPAAVCGGTTLHIATDWDVIADVDRYYQMAVQVRDVNNNKVLGIDVPPRGDFPTQAWRAGDVIIGDKYALELPDDLPPGDYSVVLALYSVETLEALPVNDSLEISLITFEVVCTSS